MSSESRTTNYELRTPIRRLLLVGHGRMGSALMDAWSREGLLDGVDAIVIEPATPSPSLQSNGQLRISMLPSLDGIPSGWIPDAVMFAVKPQSLDAVLPAYAARFGIAPLYITIAAGKETAFYAKHLGADARIVRAMPNTPALIGQGITALYCAPGTAEPDKDMAKALFSAVGAVALVDDESLMHAATALSGSGPAYVFLFLEALTEAGIAQGLDPTLARSLADQTVIGASALASASRGLSLELLRTQVTSPGGTTEAGLKPLMEGDALKRLIHEALHQAAERSKALA